MFINVYRNLGMFHLVHKFWKLPFQVSNLAKKRVYTHLMHNPTCVSQNPSVSQIRVDSLSKALNQNFFKSWPLYKKELILESLSTRSSCCHGGQPELNCQQMSRTWTRHAVVVIVTEAYKPLFASVLVSQNCYFVFFVFFLIKGMASSTEQIANKSL